MIDGRADINFENWRSNEGMALGWGKYSYIPDLGEMNFGCLQAEINKSYRFYRSEYSDKRDSTMGGSAWDHSFMIRDEAYKCNVFVIEPYYSYDYRSERSGYKLSLLAMRHVAATAELDIEPFHKTFHSSLTTAFAVRFRRDSLERWKRLIGVVPKDFRPQLIRSQKQRDFIEARSEGKADDGLHYRRGVNGLLYPVNR